MIENCPYKNKCNGIDCVNDFCMRKYRLDCLYDKSLLTDKQRQIGKLFIDQDGTDLHEFQQLAKLEQNIDKFVESGANLYIHSYNCGNGKTSWSIRLMTSYFDKIWYKSNFDCQALFISVPRYLLALKASISGKNVAFTIVHTRINNIQ